MRVIQSGPSLMARSDSALRAFVPDVLPVERGGECRLSRSTGSGATTTVAYFPSQDSAHTVVTLKFDSVGHLVRFQERRGAATYRTPPNLTPAQRDSARLVWMREQKSTTVTLDFAVDEAFATNSGGNSQVGGITGTVRAVERLERLGPPTKRIQAARQLCGV